MGNLLNLIAQGGNRLGSGFQQGAAIGEFLEQKKLRRAEEEKQAQIGQLMQGLLSGTPEEQQATIGQIATINPEFAMRAQQHIQGQQQQGFNQKQMMHAFMNETNQLLQNANTPEDVQQILQYRIAQGSQLFGPDFRQMADQIQQETGVLDVGRIRQILGKKSVKIGQYNPGDYEPKSWAEFERTGDPGVLRERSKGKVKMVAGVPYEYDSVTRTWKNLQTAEEVADIESLIAEKRKFSELTGADRAKTIEKTTDNIVKLEGSLNVYDKMIKEVDAGATTSDWAKWTPTFKESTKRFRNLANQLGLDVISSATFGALSEGEMNLAMETAVPPLEPKEMRQWLIDKKTAQEKLVDQLYEYADYLDQGGTKAGWLRKQRELKKEKSSAGQAYPEGTVIENPETGERLIMRNGEWHKM